MVTDTGLTGGSGSFSIVGVSGGFTGSGAWETTGFTGSVFSSDTGFGTGTGLTAGFGSTTGAVTFFANSNASTGRGALRLKSGLF